MKSPYYVIDTSALGEEMTRQQAEDYAKAMATRHPSSTYLILQPVGRTKHEIGVEWENKKSVTYRFLKTGEVIQEGDEWAHLCDLENWRPCLEYRFGDKIYPQDPPHRRLINSNNKPQ